MLRSLRKVASGFLAALMLLSASAMAENIPNDVPLQQIAAEAGADNYYQEAIETEIYNYKLVRNLPTTFTQDTWETYCSLANGLMDLDAENLADVQKKMVDDAVAAREALVQSQPLEESIWYIWGEDIATIEEDPSSLEFTVDSYDNADFVPFLTPYLLENQEEAKGNLIIIAGGGYSERNNSGEGWPIAQRFGELGFNCYVLQRRVAPYAPEDIWMDLQRAIRYIRYHAEDYGLGGMDCLAAVGFSGGGGTICGQIYNLYGEIQPTKYDQDYVPDEVDQVNADLDVALIMYGASANGNLGVIDETIALYADYAADDLLPVMEVEGLDAGSYATDNPNPPAMFFGIGENDTLIGHNNHYMADQFRGKVLIEEHTFAGVGHGFGVGTQENNTEYWIDMAARFMLMATGGMEKQEVALDVEVPEQYTKIQEFDYTMPFGDVHITCAMNEAEDAFYLYFTAFDDLQILEGVIEEGEPIVTFDRSGFMAGDAQNFLSQINPDAWVQR